MRTGIGLVLYLWAMRGLAMQWVRSGDLFYQSPIFRHDHQESLITPWWANARVWHMQSKGRVARWSNALIGLTLVENWDRRVTWFKFHSNNRVSLLSWWYITYRQNGDLWLITWINNQFVWTPIASRKTGGKVVKAIERVGSDMGKFFSNRRWKLPSSDGRVITV